MKNDMIHHHLPAEIPRHEFQYDLPPELIAQKAVRRGDSRLLVLNEGQICHTQFKSLYHWFRPGDCLIVNDSKVIPARLLVHKAESGGKIELLLHREIKPGVWSALSKPSRRLQPGTDLQIGGVTLTVNAKTDGGKVEIDFGSRAHARYIIRRFGLTPLPPYIRRHQSNPRSREERQDSIRYQTLFAAAEGSVAAPTAGLHFSSSNLSALKAHGVHIVPITLHVGWGTFAPLTDDMIRTSRLHAESYRIGVLAARRINHCRRAGGRIIACGTTVARTLETVADTQGWLRPQKGETSLFIQPGYTWKIVDGLITNFHFPGTSLLRLVCALAGRQLIMQAYTEAVREKYRFYSYGDAMLIMGNQRHFRGKGGTI